MSDLTEINDDEMDLRFQTDDYMFESERDGASKTAKKGMIECSTCHRFFDPKKIEHHQNICQDIFNKCKEEFIRRGVQMTDDDIVDLLVGKVPANAIKVERCEYCGKKISPKLIEKHKEQCKIKMQNAKTKEAQKQEKGPKTDYKGSHNQLIEQIKQDRKDAKKTPK